MKLEQYDYYKEQLENINVHTDYAPTVKFQDSEGNQTKYMDLNYESIPVIVEWLLQQMHKPKP